MLFCSLSRTAFLLLGPEVPSTLLANLHVAAGPRHRFGFARLCVHLLTFLHSLPALIACVSLCYLLFRYMHPLRPQSHRLLRKLIGLSPAAS